MLPIVLECDDSGLNDIHGQHIKPEHVGQAIAQATTDFAEGSVGAGTGMVSFDFKAGIGSASRLVPVKTQSENKIYTVGVFVNANLGTSTRSIFRLGGIPIAREIPDLLPIEKPRDIKGAGSAVIIIATDAPMDSRQLNRLAERASLGLGRLGAVGYNGSGEMAIAFSTANRIAAEDNSPTVKIEVLKNSRMNEFFEAVVECTEEAVINSMLAASTMEGRDNNKAFGLPHDRIKALLKKYNYYEISGGTKNEL